VSTKVRDLIDRLLTAVNDPDADSWSAPELIQYLNEGLNTLALIAVDQFTVVDTVQLVPGTRQTLPSDGVKIMRVNRGVYVDDSIGPAVREVSLRAFTEHYPEWHTAASDVVAEWAPDPNEPTTYWVNPPQDDVTPAKAEIEYVRKPDYVDVGQALPTDPAYDAALIEFILYRAYSKDADYAGQDGRAQGHYMKFKELSGGANPQPR
jgi:hypothetical protein